jgi:AcrR family transcriptional regulator
MASSAPLAETSRFAAKRRLILDTASALINERGVKGLSLGEVAERIGLGNTAVTYYFKRRDVLAAACFDRGLDLLDAQVREAAALPDTRARITRLVALHFADLADIEQGAARPIARLSDMRATDDPMRGELVRRYYAIFRTARGFFDEGTIEESKLLRLMRTHVLLETLHALPSWLDRYAGEEHGRVQTRLVELLCHGLVPGDATADSGPAVVAPAPAPDRFLDAATRLINERGYRGASVERIAAALDVTKGSFYHHLDAKDDLVLACFRHSIATIAMAQQAALAGEGDHRRQLSTALAALVAVQLGDGTPLLRSTALIALPRELRREVLDRTNRLARRFAGMIIDGISEGSIAAIDPLVAGQVLLSALNVAYECRDIAKRVPADRAVALYMSTLLHGVLGGFQSASPASSSRT